ncbi:MAG: hypothetical protein IKQ17_12530 [Kiritimatiellae bacterium]|nr:hypothetical protein [Kiritimatiellia bacterium]
MVEYAYDVMDRATNISWRTTSGATIGGVGYEYDAVGRIVSRSHAIGSNAFDRAYAGYRRNCERLWGLHGLRTNGKWRI